MAETKIYIDDDVDKRLREEAMARFGYGRGSISNAVQEAVVQWLIRRDIIKQKLGRILEKAKTDGNVIAVLMFGSYARKESDYSDVDIALLLEKKADSLGELSAYTSVIGDYENGLFDISILNDMPLDLQNRVLNESEVMYVKDKGRLYDYSIDETNRWSDFKYRFYASIKK